MTVALTINEARTLTEQCLRTGGYTADEASIIADHLIDCELRDISYGGMSRLLSILERLRDSPQPPSEITLLRENAVSASFDGGDQVGYLVAHRATSVAIEKAKQHGIAVVGANNTWMTGMFSYYAEMATREGLVALVAGNSVQAVAPHGSTEPRFGTNPLAFGFPTDDVPLIWDSGTSNVMHAEVALAKRLGRPLEEGLAFDEEGHSTTDPDAALRGAFTVWGGHKGSGLALVVQVLGMMTGADAAPVGISGYGFLVVLIDPETLGSTEDFQHRVAEYADSIRASRPVNADQPVRVPFDRSAAARKRRLSEDRIEVSDAVYAVVAEAAEKRLAASGPTIDRWRVPDRSNSDA